MSGILDIYSDHYYIRVETSNINGNGDVLYPHHIEEMILYADPYYLKHHEIADWLKKRISEGSECISPTFLENIDPERDFTNCVTNDQKTNLFSPFARCWRYVNRTEDFVSVLTIKKVLKQVVI